MLAFGRFGRGAGRRAAARAAAALRRGTLRRWPAAGAPRRGGSCVILPNLRY